MNRNIVLMKKQQSGKNSLAFIFALVSIFVFLSTYSFAVTTYKGIQPGKTTKDEVSGILGEPIEINTSTYEYPSPQTRVEKVVIEYKIAESIPIADKVDVYFSKSVARSAQIKQMNLPDSPTSQGENPEGKLQEYYGSTKSLILTYKGKTTESGVKVISFLSRERFESISESIARKPEESKPGTPDGEQKKSKTATTDKKSKKPKETTPKKQTEVVKLSPEAKQHLQQGMTYAALAQGNPKTASENYENASMEFSRAIELYPGYAEAYSNRGVAYMQQKKFNKALEDLKKAAELKPEDPIIHYNLAALYSLQNQLDLALEELDKALKYGFNNYDALKPSGPNSDPDLKNLRKHEEFRKVLEKHKVFILK